MSLSVYLYFRFKKYRILFNYFFFSRSHVTSIFKMRALVLHLVTVTFFFITWRGILQLGEEVIKTLKSPLGLETRFLTNWNFVS